MRSMAAGAGLAMLACIAALHGQTPTAGGLRIIVLAGEDAVNIVQQKTAVRPLVEVRDRNNLPVAGATVTFTIGAGQPATFAGGVRELTVTTSAAGQAEAAGFNALGAGNVQIQVQAAHQGLVTTAAISQTNFATAAAASVAGAGAAASGGSASGAAGATGGAAAAGGGGGLSATTIGIVGAAIGGGALAATQVAGGGDDRSDGTGGNSNTAESFAIYRGSFSGPFVFTNVCTGGPISPSTCVFTRSMSGTMTIDLRSDLTGGRAFVDGSQADQSVSGTQGCSLNTAPITFTTPDTTATGGPSALTATSTRGEATQRTTVTFTGAHSGNAITGSISVEVTTQTTAGATTSCNGRGTATVPITLQRTGAP